MTVQALKGTSLCRFHADVDLTGGAGQPDADLIDGKITGSVADGAEDAAPVGVAAKDSGFEEVGADHAAADGAGRLEVGGVGDFAGDEVGRALAVTGVLSAHMLGDGGSLRRHPRRVQRRLPDAGSALL